MKAESILKGFDLIEAKMQVIVDEIIKIEDESIWFARIDNLIPGSKTNKVADITGKNAAYNVDILEDLKLDLRVIFWKRHKYIELLEKLPVSEYVVLYDYYVRKLCAGDIATKRNRSIPWVYSQKQAGTKTLQLILDALPQDEIDMLKLTA